MQKECEKLSTTVLIPNDGKHQPDNVALDKLINRKKTFCQFAGLKQSGES